jgi:2-oxoglutarate ferredoxin oxidoreductase subunit beta
VEYLKTHALLKAKRDRLIEQGEKVPNDAFVVGEFMRRNRPAMGVKE